MTVYYHSAPLLLEAGSVIQPGNWGRILNAYKFPNQGNPWLVAREMLFESVRASQFPHLPSRLSSSYVFENLNDANRYLGNFTPWNNLYEVEFVDPTAVTHRGCFDLASNPPEQCDFIPVVADRARQYWSGLNISTPEVMTKSALRVRGIMMSAPAAYQP